MGDTFETNTKVLYRELFLGVVALKTPIPQNHYLHDKVPFLKSGHIYVCTMLRVLICQGVYYFMCLYICVCTMLRVLICQGVYYFMCLYICVLC